MVKMVLSARLRAIAEAVGYAKTVADVGTDHGFLPVWLLQNGRAERVVASDIAEKPLARAEKAVKTYLGDTDAVTFVLADGLDALPFPCDTVVLAGMGGETITDILSRAVPRPQRLVLQPMTSAEDLRRFLYEDGYTITDETAVREGYLYVVMTAERTPCGAYDDAMTVFSLALRRHRDDLCRAYMKKQLSRYEALVEGRKKASDRVPYEREQQLLQELRHIYETCFGS